MSYVRIQHWGKTSREWNSSNIVLRENEIGIETDTKQFKIGDGKTEWVDLPYYFPSSIKAQNNSGKISFYANDENSIKIEHLGDITHQFGYNQDKGAFIQLGSNVGNISSTNYTLISSKGTMDRIKTQCDGRYISLGFNSSKKPVISMLDSDLNNLDRTASVHLGVDYIEFKQACTDVDNFSNAYDLTRIYHNRIEIYNHGFNKTDNGDKRGIWKVIITAYQTEWYFCVLDSCYGGSSDPIELTYELVARLSAKGYTGPANIPLTEAENPEGLI